MMKAFNFIIKNDTENPPFDYYFLQNLEEKEYPIYLAKLFKMNTGENLPLKRVRSEEMGVRNIFKNLNKILIPDYSFIIDKSKCKTFNQKLQWIKLHGVTDLMRDCTDKVKVRDYVRERIGEGYLKPVLQLVRREENGVRSNNLTTNSSLSTLNTPLFDEIDFNKLPASFVMKCNHGCKWQYIIKDKEKFLNTPKLFQTVKQQMTGWIEQEYCFFGGFEMQYKNIKPKILIEKLLRENINEDQIKINVYCFRGFPKIFIKFFNNSKMSIWNDKFKPIDNIFNFSETIISSNIDNYIRQSFDLSKILSQNFDFVRIDWIIFGNKLYFEEMTFTPYSGFIQFKNRKNNFILGNL